jgi:hypothetical protein
MIFFCRIEILIAAKIKTSEKTRIKMKEVLTVLVVGFNFSDKRIDDLSDKALLVIDCSTFLDFSKVVTVEIPIDLHVPIPNQIAPARNIIAKIERMFFMKKVSIFCRCCLLGSSSSRCLLVFLYFLTGVFSRLEECR